MSSFPRPYAAATTVYVPVLKRGASDYALTGDWTPAAGDVTISIDGTTPANIGTLPTNVAMGQTSMWKYVFTALEMTGKTITVATSDVSPEAIEDQFFMVETYGNASSQHPNLGTLSGYALSAAGIDALLNTASLNSYAAGSLGKTLYALSQGVNTATIGPGAIVSGSFGTDAIDSNALAASFLTEFLATFKASNLYPNSGVARAGTTTTMQLATTASSTAGAYVGMAVLVYRGSGATSLNIVTAYDNTTKTVTFSAASATAFDTTSYYLVLNL